MPVRLRFRGLNSSSVDVAAVPFAGQSVPSVRSAIAKHAPSQCADCWHNLPVQKPPFSPKGGFLLKILEFGFRKVKITIDIYNKIL